ncbi:MAG: hypothetical protein KF699_16725 [Phycisphaeraceae bacterium]|nr:hypothetical protein [Phycisphaeraceae bacterium]
MPDQSVPPFKRFFATESDMTADQLAFFRSWRSAWEGGTAIPVDGSISYLFCYTYGILLRPLDEAASELARLSDAYRHTEPYFANYARHWLADCLVLKGDLAGALAVFPAPALGSKASAMADTLLSLRLAVGQIPRASELLALDGPAVTAWGRKHLDLVHAWIDAEVPAQSDPSILARLVEWSATAHRYPYSAFIGSVARTECAVPQFSFSRLPDATAFVRKLIREAENTAREEKNIPRVGEGWIAETELYYALRHFFHPIEVVQHARPDWLGRQHLDVFIPSAFVAVEYQGKQHDAPVSFFGGEKAWLEVRRRDAKKRRLCQANGVRLIEVRPEYSFAALVEEIVRECPALQRRGGAAGPDGEQ